MKTQEIKYIQNIIDNNYSYVIPMTIDNTKVIPMTVKQFKPQYDDVDFDYGETFFRFIKNTKDATKEFFFSLL